MRRVIARVTVVVSLVAMLIACNDGGGDSMTLEEYFAELDQIQDEQQAKANEIDLPEVDAGASFKESRDALVQLIEDSGALARETLDNVDDLDPPDEVGVEHDRFVEALRSIAEFARSFAERLRETANDEEYDEVVAGGDPLDTLDAAIRDACSALQRIADDSSIEVDLECDE